LWFILLDSIIKCYYDYIVNNRTIQEALKRENGAQAKAYRNIANLFSNIVTGLFEDLIKVMRVESFLAVNELFIKFEKFT